MCTPSQDKENTFITIDVLNIFIEQFAESNPTPITTTLHLVDDLGINDIEKLLLLLSIEDRFDVSFTPDDIAEIETIQDIIYHVIDESEKANANSTPYIVR